MKDEDLRRIAERLQQRAADLQERELVEGRDYGPYLPARIPYEEITATLRLKDALLAEFEGAELEQLYRCTEIENQFGQTLQVEDFVPEPLALLDWHHSHQVLSSQFRLLYGVGPAVERRLQQTGYRTLEDLRTHPLFSSPAELLLKALQRQDLPLLKSEVEHWFSPSHPLALSLTGLAEGKLVFFDLESLGLFGRPLVLLGLARPQDEGLLIEQYVIRSITEELPAIAAAVEVLERGRALVTYNGRAFDVNYLEERLSYYGLRRKIAQPNFDLLHHARRRFKDHLPDCRLETIERYVLGIERPLNIPSALVPEFYNTYLEQRNIGPLVAIIEHNKQDLASLAALLNKLCGDQ